jgi:hypothetical protein
MSNFVKTNLNSLFSLRVTTTRLKFGGFLPSITLVTHFILYTCFDDLDFYLFAFAKIKTVEIFTAILLYKSILNFAICLFCQPYDE